MLANRFDRLLHHWADITAPLVALDDEESRQRVTSQASLLLISTLMLIAIIPFTYFAGVPGSSFITRLLTDLACIALLFGGYRISRYNRLQLAIIWMVFPASVVIVVISIVTTTYGYLTLFFLGIPIIISGLFASAQVTVILVIFDTLITILCGSVLNLFDADILISPIIVNILMAFFTVTTVEYRQRQLDRYNLRLRHSEARYRALVESVKDILFTLSPDGKITSVNPAVTSITGWQLEELHGLNFLEVFHPDDQLMIKDIFVTIMRGERPHRIEGRARTKEGTYRWVELSASAINVEGLHGMSGVARDINSRKIAEAALEESRQRLSLVIEQMPLALMEWDTDQNLVAWNPAATQIFGYSLEEAMQLRRFGFLALEADRAKLKTVFADILEQKTFKLRTNDNLTKDGKIITCEWVNIPLVNREGQIIGIAAMAQDITERLSSQQQQMKLMLTQERLSVLQHFLSSISHDFRTSFAQIETNRYLIERSIEITEQSKVKNRLDNIGLSIQHLVAQLENLNMISSLGRLQLHPHNINLMLERVIAARQSAATTKNIQIQRNFAADVPPITLDVDKLQTAITHLLVNAINYTPEGGTITLTSKKLNNFVTISVSDTGQGILKEEQEHIFDLFYRADKARSLETGGIGVGLSISRMIAEAHGGALSVVSERGQGSTFTLTLPLRAEVKLAV